MQRIAFASIAPRPSRPVVPLGKRYTRGRRPFRLCRAIEENSEFVVPVEHYEQKTNGGLEADSSEETTQRITLKDIPNRTRHVLMYKGRKQPVQVVIGRKGVDTGVLNSLMLHFRRRDVVKVSVSKLWKDHVAELAQQLEERSGGVILERAGRRIIIFRGYSKQDAPEMAPQKDNGWWDQFPPEASEEKE